MTELLIVSDHVIYCTEENKYTSATVLPPRYKGSKVKLFGRLIETSSNVREIKSLNILDKSLEIVGYPLRKKGGIGYILSLLDIIKNLTYNIRECDVAILKMPYFSSIIAVLICKLLKKKYILYFIGFGGKNLYSKNRPFIAKILDYTTNYLVKTSHYNIFVSDELKNSFNHPNNFIILPEINNAKYQEININQNLKLESINKSSNLRIGYLGRFSEEKGVESLHKILKGISNIELELVGDGPLKQKVVSDLINENINFTDYGWIKNGSNLFDIISKWSLMLIPSKTEGFGLVVIEGNLCSVPVLANNVGGLKDIVKDGINGYLNNNIQDFRNRIFELKGDREGLIALCISSQEFAIDFLDKNNYQQCLGSFLDEVINN